MLKLMKYLKKSVGSIVLIIGLLFLQAYCDLSLPDYTSKIINVGIQQKGIEDGVPEKIRESSLKNLELFMSGEDITDISNAYRQEDGIYVLHDDITKEERENLNEIFCKPMLMLSGFSSDSEESEAMRSQMGIPEGADPAEVMAQLPPEALAGMTEEMDKKLTEMPESIMTQAAVSFVYEEYEDMGEDVDAIQMKYLLVSGGKMLLMALIIMMAAISVTFLSARVACLLYTSPSPRDS